MSTMLPSPLPQPMFSRSDPKWTYFVVGGAVGGFAGLVLGALLMLVGIIAIGLHMPASASHSNVAARSHSTVAMSAGGDLQL